MLVNASRHLTSRPPPPTSSPYAFMCVGDEVSIANRENTKAFLFKEQKLLVQTMDGGGNRIYLGVSSETRRVG